MKNITIIGGGAAAIMFAAHIDTTKYSVTLYEKKKTLGRKFLVAGEGGLNLTFNSAIEKFINKYSPNDFIDPIIRQFTNEDLRSWLESIGVTTFVGSSNRVFPTRGIKPIEVLTKIMSHLSTKNINFLLDTKWIGWSTDGDLSFEGGNTVQSDIVVFALGGASWKVTGSDGKWDTLFEERGIKVKPLRAANCAFEVDWESSFINAYAGKPLKNIGITYKNQFSKGELVVTKFGVEGNAIYALSENIQGGLLSKDNVVIYLDLKPMLTLEKIREKYKKTNTSTITRFLKKDLKLDSTCIELIKQFTDKKTFLNPDLITAIVKAVPITLKSADGIDKAISTLGGIALDEIDEDFQLKKVAKTYCIGEMLDWYAPTGGYLLQGCFSMGYALAKHLNELE